MVVMGCSGSKVDETSLVVLCRERKQYIKAASEYRNSLAASHVAYFNSLGSVGEAILKFAEEELALGSPVLHLPSREGKLSSSSPSTSFSHSLEDSSSARRRRKNRKGDRSPNLHTDEKGDDLIDNDGEGSHLHLSSSSEDGFGTDHAPSRGERALDEAGSGYSFRDGNDDGRGGHWGPGYGNYFQPPQVDRQPPGRVWDYFYPENTNFPQYPYPAQYPGPPLYPSVYGNANNGYYMRKTPTNSRTVFYDGSTSRGYGGSGFYGGESSGGYFRDPSQMAGPPSDKQPTAPPSPRASTWDFFNVFEGFDGGSNSYYAEQYPSRRYAYGSTTSSPDSKEVREREGIPDLEDEREVEVMKEVSQESDAYNVSNHKNKELLNEGVRPGQAGSVFGREATENSRDGSLRPEQAFGTNQWGSMSNGPVDGGSPDVPSSVSITSVRPEEEEISQFVDKKGVTFDVEDAAAVDVESPKFSSLSTLSFNGIYDLKEAAREIKKEFENASGCGKEVAVMLEAGKLPYYQRSTLLKGVMIVNRILYLVCSHSPTTTQVSFSPKTAKKARTYSEEDPAADIDLDRKCLSSTLLQLYAWEKKLFKEVKDEERLRIEYDKLCRRLRSLDRRGAEPGKINATQAAIRTLLTKIDICVHAVMAITNKINRLRDEELHPQIHQLIHGYIRMWNSMLRCHQKQVQAMMESKARYLLANTQGDSGLKATTDLEHELMSWCSLFNKWISSQKSYIQSLNQWLSRCLVRESEETVDGPAPFSPARVGAPPIFVICNDWQQAMSGISDKLVKTTMLDFASTLHQLWTLQDEEERQPRKGENLRRKKFEKRLQKMRIGTGMIEALEVASTESGVSRLNALKEEKLAAMKKKLRAEMAKQSSISKSVQAGLVPIFEALGNFASDVLKAHEQVRLDYTGGE